MSYDGQIVERKHKILRHGDTDFEVIEVQTVKRGKRSYKRRVGVGYFRSRVAAADYVRFTF